MSQIEQDADRSEQVAARVNVSGSSVLPRSVRLTSTVLGLQALLLAVLAVATVVWEDLLVTTWAAQNPAAQAVVDRGGLDALARSPIAVPGFGPVAVVAFLTMVLLGTVLAAVLRQGAPWARYWLTAMAGLGLVMSALSVQTAPPAGFAALGVVAGLSCVALVACLWHPDTVRWSRRRD